MNYQMDLFNRFSEQSNVDIQNLDQDNHGLLGQSKSLSIKDDDCFLLEILESGWSDDRQLEDRSARKDLEYIDDLTTLLKHTEKRKAKVGSIVHRLIGELQHMKYYLEGMSSPSTPALPLSTPGIKIDVQFRFHSRVLDRSSRARSSHRRRSVSEERAQTVNLPPSSPLEPLKTPRRPQSMMRGETTTPIQLTEDVQQQVSEFVEDNFDIKTNSSKKPSKTTRINRSLARQSARTEFSSWQSAPSPTEDLEPRETTTNPRVAFA